jgi:hypothetical protein
VQAVHGGAKGGAEGTPTASAHPALAAALVSVAHRVLLAAVGTGWVVR